MEIKAIVTTPESNFDHQTIVLDDPKDKEVLVKIVASGVCHTDATVLDRTLPVPYPAVLGHEGSGIVEKVGLSGLMAAKIAGCKPIIAVDIHDSRLELAKELGATHTINSKNEDPVAKIREINGKGANYSFETTGVPAVTTQAIQCLCVKGTMGTVAVGKNDLTINVTNEIVVRAITVKGVVEGDAVPQLFIPKLVNFFKTGQFPVNRLVEFYEPDQIAQAFEDSKVGKTIKPILVLDPSYKA